MLKSPPNSELNFKNKATWDHILGGSIYAFILLCINMDICSSIAHYP